MRIEWRECFKVLAVMASVFLLVSGLESAVTPGGGGGTPGGATTNYVQAATNSLVRTNENRPLNFTGPLRVSGASEFGGDANFTNAVNVIGSLNLGTAGGFSDVGGGIMSAAFGATTWGGPVTLEDQLEVSSRASFIGPVLFKGPIIRPAADAGQGAVAANLTNSYFKTTTTNFTLTVSGTVSNGQWLDVSIQNTGSTNVAVTLSPTLYDWDSGMLTNAITISSNSITEFNIHFHTNFIVAGVSNIGYLYRKQVAYTLASGTNTLLETNGSTKTITVNNTGSSGSSSVTNALYHTGPTNGSVGAKILTAGPNMAYSTANNTQLVATAGATVSLNGTVVGANKTNINFIDGNGFSWLVTNSANQIDAQLSGGGSVGRATNDFVLNTLYTNTTGGFAFYSEYFVLSSTVTELSKVGVYIDNNADGTWDETGQAVQIGAAIAMSDIIPAFAWVTNGGVILFTNLSVGAATATVQGNTGRRVSGFAAGNSTGLGYVLQMGFGSSSPTDAAAPKWAAPVTLGQVSSGSPAPRLRIPKNGTITRWDIGIYVNGTLGTTEVVTNVLVLNGTTTVVTNEFALHLAQTNRTTTLSQSVVVGDYVYIEAQNPTWATNPTTVHGWATLYIE